MEWFATLFLVQDETFYLGLWSLLLMCVTLLLTYKSHQSSKMHVTTSVPLIRDAFLPTIIAKPHAPVTYVACKKCGHHAVKVGDSTECLSTSCRLNKK